jgi:glycosyltransferase involved in cell wall biosynthesis
MPAVSVLLAVRDGLPWISDAIASILTQTLSALELIVIDDGSTDATPTVLTSICDERLVVVRTPGDGLTRALNVALRRARAPLIARLDADDVALPQRLLRQTAFLASHPDVGVLGTAAREVDATGQPLAVVTPPTGDADLRHALIRRNPFIHSSVVLRRALLDDLHGYDETFVVAQDYDLWMRMSRITKLANLPEPLVIRRRLPHRVSVARDAERLRAEARIRWRAVAAGQYPWWCGVFAVRPALASLLPRALRRAVRTVRGR